MGRVGLRGLVEFNNSNSNNNGRPRNNVQRNNVISLEPLERNVYRITWQNRSRKTHHLFLNPNSAAGLVSSMHPGQGVRVNTLNAILAAAGPNEVMLRHPTTREQTRRRQVNKVRNPQYVASPRRSPARRSSSRSPARRSVLNRARSAGRAAARTGLAAARAGRSAGRAAGHMAYGAATAVYRRMTAPSAATRQRQLNNQEARIRRIVERMGF